MRAIPKEAVDLVASLEGCRLMPYRDSVGVLTVGYGSTGSHVVEGEEITQARARKLLAEDLRIAQRRLYGVVKAEIIESELTDNQWAALLSFVFNLGAGKSWTIWKRLNARQFDAVPLEMMKFVNAGGRKLKGLVNRRTAEVRVWSTDEPGSADEDPPSSETRFAVTPPTPAEPRPPQKQATFLTTAGAAVGSVSTGAIVVKDQLEPLQGASETLDRIYILVAVIAALLALAATLFVWLKSREHRN